jgi:predicted  nucleic acid-binding Zn-ribbon protein
MVHTCAKCGKVYPDSSPEILSGCSACGGKKFYFERPEARSQTPASSQCQEEDAADEQPVATGNDHAPRVESIRIIAPGTYELNIEKMAQSDDTVVGLGREGSYAVDLLSMAGRKKKKG